MEFFCRGTVRLCDCVENSSEFKSRRILIGRSRAFVHLQEFRRCNIAQIVHNTGKDTEYAKRLKYHDAFYNTRRVKNNLLSELHFFNRILENLNLHKTLCVI